MQKNLVITLVLGFMLISFASAYGSYSSFSFGDLLDSIDSSTMLLGCLFMIFFAIINFALSRVFKDQYGNPNKPIVAIISITVPLLMIYGINKTGFGVEDFIYDLGISGSLLSTLIPIIFLVGAIFLISRFGFKGFFLTFGALFVLLSFTDLIYAKGLLLIIGIVFVLIGLYLMRRDKKKYSLDGGFGGATGAIGRRSWDATKWAGKKIGRGAQWAGTGGGRITPKWGFKKAQLKTQEYVMQRESKRVQQNLQIQYNNYKTIAYKIQKRFRGNPPQGSKEAQTYQKALNKMEKLEGFARKNGYSLT